MTMNTKCSYLKVQEIKSYVLSQGHSVFQRKNDFFLIVCLSKRYTKVSEIVFATSLYRLPRKVNDPFGTTPSASIAHDVVASFTHHLSPGVFILMLPEMLPSPEWTLKVAHFQFHKLTTTSLCAYSGIQVKKMSGAWCMLFIQNYLLLSSQWQNNNNKIYTMNKQNELTDVSISKLTWGPGNQL